MRRHHLLGEHRAHIQALVQIAAMTEQLLALPERWHQDSWGVDDEGDEILFDHNGQLSAHLAETPRPQRGLCLASAIRLASAAVLGCDAGDIIGAEGEPIFRRYVEAANAAMQPQIHSVTPYLDAVVTWNDDPQRTHGDIRALTRKVTQQAHTENTPRTPRRSGHAATEG